MNAFNREYDNDNSWEQLQEDEYGHLRPLVRLQHAARVMWLLRIANDLNNMDQQTLANPQASRLTHGHSQRSQ